MKRNMIIALLMSAFLAGCASSDVREPAKAPAAPAAESRPVPAKTQKQIDAEKKGAARAEADIRRGVFRIIICGERFPGEKPQRDAETGLMEYNEEGDDIPYNEYFDEMHGYNAVMREYVKTHGKPK